MLKAFRLLVVVFILFTVFSLDATSVARADEEGPAYVPKRLIVGFKSTVSTDDVNTIQTDLGATTVDSFPEIGAELWQISNTSVAQAVTRYKNDPRLKYVEPDYIVSIPDAVQTRVVNDEARPSDTGPDDTTPNDPRFNELWGLNKIRAVEAWDRATGTNVVVGVIDTGVDYTHADIAGNMWTNPGEIPNDGVDNDNNGYIDDIRGWDCRNDDNDPMDGDSHGTHVAGTIAAIGNNGTGVVGVSWSAQIMALKFLSDSGSGTTSDAIECVLYAANNGARLTNNSWGGGGFSSALVEAIEVAGLRGQLFIAAAGNNGRNTDISPHYPSSYASANIISVAATNDDDGLASFSNYGRTSVDLCAPGVSILSTVPGNSYGRKSGTSMAAPHVTGVAVLLWSRNPGTNLRWVKDRITDFSDPVSACNGRTMSGGRLNADRALRR
jgi:subtilisin family serine protease